MPRRQAGSGAGPARAVTRPELRLSGRAGQWAARSPSRSVVVAERSALGEEIAARTGCLQRQLAVLCKASVGRTQAFNGEGL